MSHVAEGSMQAYLDGELDSAQQDALTAHLAACASCAAELATLRSADQTAHAALTVLDEPVPMLRARAALAAHRAGTSAAPAAGRFARLGLGGLARAAMLLLMLAGAGAAAIPDSPVRRALEAAITRVADLFTASERQVVQQPPAPAETPPSADAERETSSIAIAPSGGSVAVEIRPPTGALEVVVRLADGPRARVETSTERGGVRFVSGAGRLEVVGLGTGDVLIEIPRSVGSATIRVGGLVHAQKQGDELRLTGPAGDGQGTEVRFWLGG